MQPIHCHQNAGLRSVRLRWQVWLGHEIPFDSGFHHCHRHGAQNRAESAVHHSTQAQAISVGQTLVKINCPHAPLPWHGCYHRQGSTFAPLLGCGWRVHDTKRCAFGCQYHHRAKYAQPILRPRRHWLFAQTALLS